MKAGLAELEITDVQLLGEFDAIASRFRAKLAVSGAPHPPERALARIRTLMRNEGTRHKIELGGLVIKDGLSELDRAVILGILPDARTRMEGKDGGAEQQRFL